MTTRRDFLRTGGVALGGLALSPTLLPALPSTLPGHASLFPPAAPLPPLYTDPATRELMMEALDAAKRAGASWADVRISRNRNNSVQTREKQVTDVVDVDTMGCGVRVLVDGCWGFAATQELTKAGVGGAAQEAVALAKANRVARDRRVELAPTPAHPDVTWRSSYTIDPFTIAVEEKADLLLRANAAALTVANVRFVNSGLSFVKEERNYANTEGTVTTQDYVRSWVTMSCTAVAPDRTGTAVRGPEVVQPAGRGWEYVLEADIVNNARWPAKPQETTARPVEPGRYDLILHPRNCLTIHESIGHSTELDRPWATKPTTPARVSSRRRRRYWVRSPGPPMMNVIGNRSEVGALATIGYDDDGVAGRLPHREGRRVRRLQTTREQAPVAQLVRKNGKPLRSHGCAAQSWADVSSSACPTCRSSPRQGHRLGRSHRRHRQGHRHDRRASYSIDQQRYNASSAHALYEIRKGRSWVRSRMPHIRCAPFWNTLDMLGGKKSYMHGGTFNDGKGQPGQANAVSHGCPPARFRNANIINTGRDV